MDSSRRIAVGLTHERSRSVTSSDLATAHGSGTVEVLATPALLAFCEEATRSLIDPLLPDGRSTVGTSIDFRHTAATPLGLLVTVCARLVEVDGRRLRFELVARDEIEEIGRGTHERFVIELDRFQARVADKVRLAEK